MGIKLDFWLAPSWNPNLEAYDFAEVGAATLRDEVFLGDIIFQVGELDVSAHWGWVPALDFAAALVHAVRGLEEGSKEEALDFTESDAEIRFSVKPNGTLEIRSNYTDGSAETTLEELGSASRAFARSLLSKLCSEWPALKRNSNFAPWYPCSP